MKTKSTFVISFLLFFTILGCKREDLIKETPTQFNASSEKVRAWFDAQKGIANSERIMLEGKVINILETPQWYKTEYFKDAKKYITPITIVSASGNVTTNKYLVAEMDDAENVINASYYQVLSTDGTKMAVVNIIRPDLVNSKMLPDDFSGAIIKYDLNNNIIFARHFENGVLADKTDKLAIKKSKTQVPVENYAPLEEGCSYVTTDWYWQTWENGVLTNEVYLYSTTEIFCQAGGGGGGSGTPTSEQILDMMFNNGAVKSQKLAPIEISTSPTATLFRYPWMIYQISYPSVSGIGGFDYAFFSEEVGEKNLGSDNRWHWQSFTHSSISRNGYTMGTTSVQCNNVVGVSNIGQGFFSEWASMNLSFDVDISFIFQGVNASRSKPENTGCIWSIYYEIPPQ